MADDNQSSDCDSDVGDGGDSSGHGSGMVTGNGFSGGMWRPSVQPADPCYRCGKRVYPVERVDVGVLFHRRCFRCRVCGLQLSLRSFHWDQGTPASSGNQTGQGSKQGQGQADVQGRGTAANVGDFLLKHGSPPHGNGLLYNQNGGSEIGSNVKDVRDHGHSSRSFSADVYCNVHVPRAVGRIDGEAVGIKQALAAPRRGADTCDQVSSFALFIYTFYFIII